MGAVARRNLEERGDGAAKRQNQREEEECTLDYQVCNERKSSRSSYGNRHLSESISASGGLLAAITVILV